MKFSLIICTYERPESLVRLLNSVIEQVRVPNEILIIDGSENSNTENVLVEKNFTGVRYFRVEKENRGLTRQRNFGIDQVSEQSEIVCFLDDDIVLKPDYFEKLISTYELKSDAVAVGGYILDDTEWKKVFKNYQVRFDEYCFDGYIRKLGSRHTLRKRLGLLSDRPPGFMPKFSHGFSTGFLPPSGKTYPVEFFMGGVSSYKKSLFDMLGFSSFFEGYGLYEDMDFCLRASKKGRLYLNTAAQVFHLHEEAGRPDYKKYGKMVIRNGYRVWRLKYPKPSYMSKFKWYSVNFLLGTVRCANAIKGEKNAWKDAEGRFLELLQLMYRQP